MDIKNAHPTAATSTGMQLLYTAHIFFFVCTKLVSTAHSVHEFGEHSTHERRREEACRSKMNPYRPRQNNGKHAMLVALGLAVCIVLLLGTRFDNAQASLTWVGFGMQQESPEARGALELDLPRTMLDEQHDERRAMVDTALSRASAAQRQEDVIHRHATVLRTEQSRRVARADDRDSAAAAAVTRLREERDAAAAADAKYAVEREAMDAAAARTAQRKAVEEVAAVMAAAKAKAQQQLEADRDAAATAAAAAAAATRAAQGGAATEHRAEATAATLQQTSQLRGEGREGGLDEQADSVVVAARSTGGSGKPKGTAVYLLTWHADNFFAYYTDLLTSIRCLYKVRGHAL